jgi:hypothetical protein
MGYVKDKDVKVVHQENDTLPDLSDLSCTRHVRRNKRDLMDLTQAMYL